MFRRIGYLFAFAWGLTVFGLFVAGYVYLLTYVPGGLRSQTWPAVVGQVQQSQTVSYSRGRILRVDYEFQVNGVTYASSRFRFSPKNGPSTGEAIWEDYAPGKAVTVFYNPDDPNQCVLQPGVYAGDGLIIVVFGAVLALFVAILWRSLRGSAVKRPSATSMDTGR
jgi:hypothetical protein